MSADREYTARLEQETGKRWKRLLGVQAPYRRLITRVAEGRLVFYPRFAGSCLHPQRNGCLSCKP